ncbi:ClbS/DfsB family four-helix bundle protein [Cellulomonas sp. RIT-PI-Y]|uniref:ClbS/DfsB family four-helix bundle protein n=1 Tax=Cellulomonas sp. RIT-PI-Y TaxID=3035297 RepID=UPI0021DA5EAF|nr:ClbS/DfsB family four-helix bundle protein [Cellulomonas sp. RIT-PI-Y]
MAVPRDKGELVRAIDDSYDKLVRDLARVPVGLAGDRSMPGHRSGTVMSPSDLVAYLIGWFEQVLSWHEDRGAGNEPDFPATGYAWNELGALAEEFYRLRSWLRDHTPSA